MRSSRCSAASPREGKAEERSPSSPPDSWNVAPRWSWPSAQGCCREDGAHQEVRGDASSPEAEDCSPSSQASARSGPAAGIEERRWHRWRPPKSPGRSWRPASQHLHRRLRLNCATNDLVLMHFVEAAIEEKLARSRGAPAKRWRVKAQALRLRGRRTPACGTARRRARRRGAARGHWHVARRPAEVADDHARGGANTANAVARRVGSALRSAPLRAVAARRSEPW